MLAMFLHSVSAWSASIVTPNGQVNVEGNGLNFYPFHLAGNGGAGPSQRYQQVYSASSFAILTEPSFITQIAFRPDNQFGGAFVGTLPDIQINLSTTSATPDTLSLTFASNVGANDTVVFTRGALALSSNFAGAFGAPKDFDIVITLTTPFLYDPAAGNLLLDVRNFGGGSTTVFDMQEVAGDGVARVHTSSGSPGLVNSPTAARGDTGGLVTKFTIVPEPDALALLAAGLFALARRRPCAAIADHD
jgi:hypothetical protein